MNSKTFKVCAVPLCKNTSKNTPNKVFVHVPREKPIRFRWFELARRIPTSVCLKTSFYFCEDHFDLPNDMVNYMEYHLMGLVPRVCMKPGCFPTKFECQPDRTQQTSDTAEGLYVRNKKRKLLIEESEKDLEERTIKLFKRGETLSESSISCANITQDISSKTANKSIQVYITHKFRSKSIQAETKLVNQMTSPLRPFLQSASTSPFKVINCIHRKNKPSTFTLHRASRKIVFEESDSDISYTPSLSHRELSPSIVSLQIKSTSDCSEQIEDDKKQMASKILEYTLLKIMKSPRYYIGVPKSCYYLINLIEQETSIPVNHILLCLRKLRLNNPFRELADDFAITQSYASKIFIKNIPVLASVMQPFIVNINNDLNKRNLPMAFRHKFHYVSCIIDCLEIETQKPSKALHQSLTWSEYKKANTIKYLISCTPNGLVNYISPGYGGRITDTCIVETSDFIKCLKPGMCVMADRGFKHVDQHFRKNGILLVRPPSTTTGNKLSKSEARETKQIASLRIHVERVIRRLREFTMLKPHVCLNNNLVKILDNVITIACGLINIQDSLIK